MQGVSVGWCSHTILKGSGGLRAGPLASQGSCKLRQARMALWIVRGVNDVEETLKVVNVFKKRRLGVLGMCEMKLR